MTLNSPIFVPEGVLSALATSPPTAKAVVRMRVSANTAMSTVDADLRLSFLIISCL